jgi:adenine-specific DNA-methyltransferase
MAEGGEREYLTPTRTELVWPGKHTQMERIALPFQIVETVNQSRATREQIPMLAGLPPPPLFEGQTTVDTSWKNKLIWGENKYVMASLLQGDPSIELEPLAGKIDLIYIDPPFATGQDFSYRARVGDEEWLKQASIIEETAYRDTWGTWPRLDSYLQVMYERLVLMKDLLSDTGSIYVHLDWHVGHYLKLLMDDIFDRDNFRNEIVWRRHYSHNDGNRYGCIHDIILWFSKSENYVWNRVFLPYEDEYIERNYQVDEITGRRYRSVSMNAAGQGEPRYFGDRLLAPPPGTHWRWSQDRINQALQDGIIYFTSSGVPRYKQFLEDVEGLPVQDTWIDFYGISSQSGERRGFETQKPEALLERIIKASSDEGDLVADFFCGSGTTQAVAEKLGRHWIGCDLSRFAIQVTRKRLLDIADCQPFEIFNLGKYERRHWQMNVLNGEQEDGSRAIADYLRFIVALYHAESVEGYGHLHGQKAGRWVHVGGTDAAVTRAEVMDAVRECQAHHYTALDVLGWEWEMGLHDTICDEARRLGVDLRLLYIPREVMDKRAVEAGDVHFYELAYLKISLLQDGHTATVRLDDFIIPNPDLVPDEVRSKVKKWSDYIDFWAVDWNYAGDTFHNEWQTYRTRKSPTLRLISDPHTYPEPGKYRVLIKVIDIFGNDTTQLLEVAVP